MPKQPTLTGWLTVKKRGRDDDRIQKDRKTAIERKRKRVQTKRTPSKGTKQSKSKGAAKKSSKPASNGSKQRKSTGTPSESESDFNEEEDVSDEEEVSDFVVHSDEDDDDDDDDELVSEVTPSSDSSSPEHFKRRRKATTATTTTATSKSRKRSKGRGRKPAKRSTKSIVESDSEYDNFSSDDLHDDFIVPSDQEDEDSNKEEEILYNVDDLKVNKQVKPWTKTRNARTNVKESNVIGEMSRTSQSSGAVKDHAGGNDDDDSDTEDGDHIASRKSFLDSFKYRPSRPSQQLQRASIAAKTRPNKPLAAPTRLRGKGTLTLQKQKQQQQQQQHQSNKIEDSSDELTSPSPPIFAKKARAVTSKKELQGTSQTQYFHSKRQKSFPGIGTVPALKLTKQNRRGPNDVDDDDDDSLDEFENGTRKHAKLPHQQQAKGQMRNYSLDDYTSSSGDDKKLNNSHGNNNNEEEEFLDEDEQVALSWALKESVKDINKPERRKVLTKKKKPSKVVCDSLALLDNAKVKSKRVSVKEKPKVQIELEDSSDNEDDNDDNDSVDVDLEETKAASEVLQTAEKLSAQVLKTMMRWMNEKDSTAGSTPHGMIVDGAISLSMIAGSQLSQDDPDDERRDWISHEIMAKACPNITLADYQLVGVNWLALLHGMKCSIEGKRETNVNGILADEMGLGKTAQTISFLAWLKYKRTTDNDGSNTVPRPHLVVVPTSVFSNWLREFETFCPAMNVVPFHGTMLERDEMKDKIRDCLSNGKSRTSSGPPIDVILATVSTFSKEKSNDRAFLCKFQYEYLVVDEAHALKNSDSLRYKSLNRVRANRRLLLTGTPVQNKPLELMNMLCFLMPLFSRVGSNGFDDAETSQADRMLQHFVDLRKGEENTDEYAYKKLKQLFAPFVLRRKKSEVLAQAVPPKERLVVMVELDTAARKGYDAILLDSAQGTKLSGARGNHLFTSLRKAAHHPLLLRNRYKTPEEAEQLVNIFLDCGAFGNGVRREMVEAEVANMNDFNIHLLALELMEEHPEKVEQLNRYVLEEEALFSSAKFEHLRVLLPKLIADSHRVLIFSCWTMCLDLLGCLMENMNIGFLRMDGSIPQTERQNLIDKFNKDDSIGVFLLSTTACGVGINLTAADTCIIHDLDFNPFNDLQAEDRCHRIGQKRKVTVYKLVTKDTVDSDIYDMQERKSKMNAAIMEKSFNQKAKQEILRVGINRALEANRKHENAEPRGGNLGKDEREPICLI